VTEQSDAAAVLRAIRQRIHIVPQQASRLGTDQPGQ
jgi:hypothetical protein